MAERISTARPNAEPAYVYAIEMQSKNLIALSAAGHHADAAALTTSAP